MDVYHIGFDIGYRDGINLFTEEPFDREGSIEFDSGKFGWTRVLLSSLSDEDMETLQLGYDDGNDAGYQESHLYI